MSRNETPSQILSRLLGRTVRARAMTLPAEKPSKKPRKTAKKSRKIKAPLLSKLTRERVRLDGFQDPVDLVLVAEMVLQELERGGYGGVELRGTGRTAANLADAAGIPVAVAGKALMLLSARWLARYGRTDYQPDVLLWAPVRDLEASPYTFNTSDVPGVYEPPERIDFRAAVIEERGRISEERKQALITKVSADASAALRALTGKRGRGRPRKALVGLRPLVSHSTVDE